MREESHNVSAVAHYYTLPDTPYDLWLPDDGTRVEVVGGEMVVSPPRTAQAVLYSDPDPSSGAYLHFASWKFGETIRLPDPFGIEIVTDGWGPWDG